MLKRLLFALFVVAMFSPCALFAQAEPIPDPKKAGADAILALTPIVGVFVIWALKLAWSKVPASALLVAGPVLGIGINYALTYLAGHPPADLVLGALAGAVATWIREFGNTLVTKGALGATTPTKLSF